MDSSLPPLLQATSGAIASAVAGASVFPLDSATTSMQHADGRDRKLSLLVMLQRLTRRNRLSRIYAGLSASTLSTLLSSFLYFYLYSALHKMAVRRHRQAQLRHTQSSPAGIGAVTSGTVSLQRGAVNLGAAEELLIGVLAGVTAKGIVLPISAVCVRQQLDHEEQNESEASGSGKGKPKRTKGVTETLGEIQREKGFLGLWSSLPPSIPLALLPSLTLYIHSVLLRLTVPARHRAHPPGSATFFLGAASSALATLPLYPMILTKVLSQSGAPGAESDGLIDTLKTIVGMKGFTGLYQGLEGQLVKGFIQQGVMMLLKQRIEEGIVKTYRAFH